MKVYSFMTILLFVACTSHRDHQTVWCEDDKLTENITEISFNQLYRSTNLDGKTVTLEGRFSYNFEDIALYPSFGSGQEGVWLKFTSDVPDSLLKRTNGKKIAVTGVVDTHAKGHLNSYFCTIYNISCIRE